MANSEDHARPSVVLALGAAQTIAWASSYYLPAMLAAPMARDMGVSVSTVFAAFSMALLISALVGPKAGRFVDQHGGRPLLMGSNLLFAGALLLLAAATGPWSLFACWSLLGLAMGSGLYEAAFACLVRMDGQRARSAITGISLIAGFASTVGWPLTGWLESELGWRGTCVTWAALHLAVGLPLNALLPNPARPSNVSANKEPDTRAAAAPRSQLALLSVVFDLTWFISTAIASHLPTLLAAQGVSAAVAMGLAALVGPAQVAGRLLEFAFLKRTHPLVSARLASLAHPAGAAALLLAGPALAPLFSIAHGVGNGILTVVKGSLPLVLFGTTGYGARQGLLMVPARIAQAAAPFLFGHFIDSLGAKALWVTSGLGFAATASLLAMGRRCDRLR